MSNPEPFPQPAAPPPPAAPSPAVSSPAAAGTGVPPRQPNAIERFFGGNPLAVLLRLALLSVVIGVIMAVLGFDPRNLIEALRDLVDFIIGNSAELIEALVRYFLLGAAIVFPVWLVIRLLRSAGR
jgi:hypothetical protein